MKKEEINCLFEEKKNYLNKGFCEIRNFISIKQRDYLLMSLEKLVDFLILNGNEGSFINFADKNLKIVNSIHRLQEINDNNINKFILENNFNFLAEFLTTSKCFLFSIQAFLKPPGFGLKTPGHQDNAYWCHEGNGGLTLWISIDKAGKNNAMMKYASNTDQKIYDHKLSKNTPGSSLVIPDEILSKFSWHQPELNPGDIAVHNGLVVHYSDQNKSNFPRRGFLLNYRPVECKRDEKRYEEYLNNLERIYGRK